MSQHRLRPRYELRVALAPDDLVRAIQLRLAAADCPCRGYVAAQQRVIDLRVLPEQRHLWSPALGLQIEPDPEEHDASVVHALIGPEPGVWTTIAFSYVALLTGLLFALTLGVVQRALDQSAWAFWLAGLLVLGLAGVWWIGRMGQELAAPQTARLRHFVEDTLGLSATERARTDADPYHD